MLRAIPGFPSSSCGAARRSAGAGGSRLRYRAGRFRGRDCTARMRAPAPRGLELQRWWKIALDRGCPFALGRLQRRWTVIVRVSPISASWQSPQRCWRTRWSRTWAISLIFSRTQMIIPFTGGWRRESCWNPWFRRVACDTCAVHVGVVSKSDTAQGTDRPV